MSENLFNENERMACGKYKGRPLNRIADIDPQYLVWAHDQAGIVSLTREQRDTLVLRDRERRRPRSFGRWQDPDPDMENDFDLHNWGQAS